MSEDISNASEVLDSIDGAEEVSNVPAGEEGEEGSLDIQDAVNEALGGGEGPEGSEEEENSEESDSEKKDLEEEIKSLKKKLKLKVDGVEIEEEIDFDDDERLIKALQKEKAFDSRSQELSSMKKQVTDFVGALKANPAKVLADMGLSMDDIAETHIESMIEQAKKSPDQIAKEEMENELRALREEAENAKKMQEDAEMERMRNEHAQQIEVDIKDALGDTESILPDSNPWVLRKVAETMLFAMRNGYPDVTAKDVIPLVEDQYRTDLKGLFDVLPEETLEKIIGKNNLDRMRKKRLKKRPKTATPKQAVKTTSSKVDNSGKSEDKKSYKDFFSIT